jgi:hypothetical protein
VFAGENVEQGAFSGPVSRDKRNFLALIDAKCKIGEQHPLSEGFGEIFSTE